MKIGVRTLAREVKLKCDICRQDTDRIVAKLFFAPSIPGVSKMNHSDYTKSCDVGRCCEKRLLKGFNFKQRLTAAEYNGGRKQAANAG